MSNKNDYSLGALINDFSKLKPYEFEPLVSSDDEQYSSSVRNENITEVCDNTHVEVEPSLKLTSSTPSFMFSKIL